MKKTFSLFLCVFLLMSFVMPAFATEVGNEATACNHSWTTTDQTEATCTATGEKKLTCSLCGDQKTETISATGHSFGSPVTVDDSSHKKICTICGTEETAAHSWDNGTVVSQATCVAEGSKTYTCTCGKTKTERLSKLEHDLGTWTKDSQNHERSCKNCTYKETGKHSIKEEVVKEATCLEAGSKKKYCTICDMSEMIVVSKLTTHTYDTVCDLDCNICGAKRTTSHSYGSSWSRDHTGHWHECTKCGEKVDFRSHYPGPAATEDAPQLCVTCDYVITQQKEHQHSYEKKWTKDDSGHWYKCASCDVKKDFAQHVYDSDCDSHCNVCDYENPDAHDYGNSWKTDERKHWAVCKTCNHKTDAEPHIPGDAATETQAQLCTVCGYEIEPVQEHEHSFGPTWMYDGKTHWQACICGEQSVPAEHTWNDGTKNRDKTVTYLCMQCQAEKIEKASGFPWWILIVFVLMAAGGGAAAYVYYYIPYKQTGKFSAK